MKHTGTIALILSLLLTGWLIVDKFTRQDLRKTGVVQMEQLVYDYKGMKEATKDYTRKMETWKNESDSMETTLKNLYSRIKTDSLKNDRTQLNKDIQLFMNLKETYGSFVKTMQEKAGSEDQKMTLGVINQLNEAIKQYAVKHGYDIVLCNSQQQSVGYVKDQMDITKDVLEFANASYDGTK